MIWRILPNGHAAGRAIMIIFGGAGMLTVLLLSTASIHNTVTDRLSGGMSPSLAMSIYVLVIFLILPTVSPTDRFDRDELIGGIGHLPNHVMLASRVASAFAVLASHHPGKRGGEMEGIPIVRQVQSKELNRPHEPLFKMVLTRFDPEVRAASERGAALRPKPLHQTGLNSSGHQRHAGSKLSE